MPSPACAETVFSARDAATPFIKKIALRQHRCGEKNGCVFRPRKMERIYPGEFSGWIFSAPKPDARQTLFTIGDSRHKVKSTIPCTATPMRDEKTPYKNTPSGIAIEQTNS
jgi:hypothetical protein